MASFTDYLARLVKAADLTQQELADGIGHSLTFAHHVVHGERKVPLDQTDRWAATLLLSGDARREFIEMVLLDHSPPEMADLVASLRAEVERLREENRRMKGSKPGGPRRR